MHPLRTSAYVGDTVKRLSTVERAWVAWLWLIVAAAAAMACDSSATAKREWTPDDHGQPPGQMDDGPAAPIQDEEGGEARAARALWGVSCASCHGASGRGDGPSPPPGANMPDLASPDFQRAHTDERLLEVISKGNGLMPAFGSKLSPKAIHALVAHVRTFAAAAEPASAKPPGHP